MTNYVARIPSYIFRSKHGVYYFQSRVPKRIWLQKPHLNKIIRKSLRTKDKQEAIKLARRLLLEMDLREYEIENEDLKAKIRRGSRIYEEYEHVVVKSSVHRDMILDDWSNQDMECYLAYVQYMGKPNNIMGAIPVIPDGEVALVSNSTPENLTSEIQSDASGSDTKLSDVAKSWIEFHSTTDSWAKTTIKKMQACVNTFCYLLNEPFLSELNSKLVSDRYILRINQLPKNRQVPKHYRIGSSLSNDLLPPEELIAVAKLEGADTLSKSTVLSEVENIISFLKWAKSRYPIDVRIYEILEDYTKKQSKVSKSKSYDYFNDADLKLLFHTSEYFSGEFLESFPERHFVPLIGLYTGARLGEICQLDLSNIKETDGVYFFQITSDEEKNQTVKTESSKRKVPIHKDLISLGLLNYAKHLERKNENQLFPKLSASKDGTWGRSISRWFNGEGKKLGYIESCGVEKKNSEGNRRVFHSLRHSFISFATYKKIPESAIYQLSGHSKGAIQAKDCHDSYLHYPVAETSKFINSIDFGLDISRIKKFA